MTGPSAPGGKLIMNEVHRPGLVRSCGRLAILAQLCLDPVLRRHVERASVAEFLGQLFAGPTAAVQLQQLHQVNDRAFSNRSLRLARRRVLQGSLRRQLGSFAAKRQAERMIRAFGAGHSRLDARVASDMADSI